MNKRNPKYILGIAAATSCLLVTAANADVLNYSVNYGSAGSPLSASFSNSYALPTFDSTLGTLTSVSITLNTFDVVSSEIVNISGPATAYGGAMSTLPVTVTALDGLNATTTGTATYGPGVANPGFSITVLPGQASTLSASDILNSGFSDYVGIAGQMFNLDVASGDLMSTIINAPGNLGAGSLGTSYGNVDVQYTFTPVPEPTTLAMAGLGGFATLFFARRRK